MSGKTKKHLEALRELRGRAVLGGGQKRIDQQRERCKLTARERLALLLDEGSFQEFGALATHEFKAFGLDKQRFPDAAGNRRVATDRTRQNTSRPPRGK